MTPSGENFGLCLNACVLAKSLQKRGRACFQDGEAVLKALTEEQIRSRIETYLSRFSGESTQSDRAVNPQFDESRFEELRGR